MADFTAYLRLAVDSRDARTAVTDLNRVTQASRNTERATESLGRTATGSFSKLNTAIGSVAVALATNKIIEYSDAWTSVNNVLKQVTDSENELLVTRSKTLQLSKDTFSSLEGTARLYAEITRSVSALGVSEDRVIGVTKTINNLFLAGGKSAKDAAGAITQLNQGFASGVLRGDEFNSVAEGAPRILDALAQSLKISRGELRDFAATGGITSEILVTALESYSSTAQKMVDTTTRTFAQNSELAKTLAVEFVGTSESLASASALAGQSLLIIANNLNLVSDAALIFSVVVGAKVVSALAAKTTATIASIAATNAQIAVENSAAVGAQRRAVVEQEAAAASLAKARADSVAATAAVNAARANGTTTQSIAALIIAQNEQAITQARLTGSILSYTTATTAANAANARLAASTTAMASIGAGATAIRGLSSALALIGGPVGLAVIAAAGIAYFALSANDAEKAADKLGDSVDGLAERYASLGKAQKAQAEQGLNDQLFVAQREAAKLKDSLDKLSDPKSQSNVAKYGIGGITPAIINETAAKLETVNQKVAGIQEKLAIISSSNSFEKVTESAESFAKTLKFKSGADITDDIMRYADAAYDALIADTARAKTIKDMNAQIARESYLLGNTSKEIELQYDIKNKLIDITEQEAKNILASARAFDDYSKANKSAAETAELFSGILKDINGNIDDLNKLNIDRISDDLSGSVGKVSAYFDDIDEAAKKSAESIKDSITDSLLRGFEDGKGLVENFRDTVDNIFKTLVLRPSVELITDQLSKQISSVLGSVGTKGSDGKAMGASGLLGSLGPYAAIGIAVGGSLISSWNDKQDAKFEKLTAAYRQGIQSTGTVLGDANKKSESIANAIAGLNDTASSTLDVNYGMYRALLAIQDGIAGAAAGFARTVDTSGLTSGIKTGTSTGAGIDALLSTTGLSIAGKLLGGDAGGFIDSILGGISKAIYNKKTSIINSGIKIIGTNLADILETGTLEAFSFADVKTKKSFLGITTSSKVKEQTEALDEIFKAQFASVFVSAGTALEEASKVFGVAFDPAKFLVDATKLSLKDLEGDELTAEIESFFSSTLDTWAGFLVSGTDTLLQFQKVGEGAFETVIRLASETNTFSQYASLLSFNFKAVGLSAVGITQNIADLSGGFDQLSTSLGAYYQNFFTDSERTAAGLAQIGDKLKTIGVDAVPTSREAFRALIEAIDLSTAAGQEQFALMISLSGAFAQLVPATKSVTDATEAATKAAQEYSQMLKDNASSAFEGLRASINAEKSLIAGVVSSAYSAKSAVDSAIGAEKDRLKASLDVRLAAIKAQADAEKEAQDAIAKARVESIKEQQSAVNESIRSMESLSNDLNSTIYDMAIGSDKLTLARRRAAEFEIDTALANARAGRGLPLAGQLTGSLGIVKQNDPALYRNAAEMAFATAVTQNKLAELAKITGESISDSQRQLDILSAQLVSAESYSGASLEKYDEMIKAANDQYALDVAALDATAKTAQEQYDALTGIDTSVLTLNESLSRYAEIIANASFSNAKEQTDRLDAQLLKAENQLNALLGIDNSVLSLKDSVDKFIASLVDLNEDINKDNIAALEAIAGQIQGLRDEQRVQSLKQLSAMETTAMNTSSIAYDTVPA